MSSPKTEGLQSYIPTIVDYLLYSLGPGKPLLQPRYIINTFKCLTPFYIVFLMYVYQNFSLGSYVYLAIHGSYGMIWLLKDFTFPDRSWQIKAKFFSLIIYLVGNMLFWTLPYMQISKTTKTGQTPSVPRMTIAITTYIIGVCVMMISDAQKYYQLKYRSNKDEVICDGMFKFTRSPNYLGETLLYLGIALIINKDFAYLIVIVFQGFFMFNLLTLSKDIRSLSKKKGWQEYSQISGRFFPRILSNGLMNRNIYILLLANILYYIYIYL